MPATPVRPPEYRRREPEKEPLYQVLAGHPETFLQHTRTSEHQLPLHVEKEMRAYLECGILAYGFVRARCEDCGAIRAVAFSCKKRGFCPSCCGRRMADTAARLVDGVYVDGEEAPVFVAAPPWSDQAVQQIVETSARRIIRSYTKRGLLDDTAADRLADEEPVLAALTAASVRGLIATGARAGQRLRRALRDPAIGVRTASLCFASRGFSLHAATRTAGPDRRGLERLCRYVARPPLATRRLRLLASQRLCFALKTPWSDGTSHLLLSPMELLEKLAALVPPPRLHLLRYHGLLAPRARGRGRIVPAKPVEESTAADRASSVPPCAHRLRWATLLARVLGADLSACAACGGRLRIIAALTDPASIRTYLEGVGLPAMPPPRAPPQPQFELVA